MTDTHPQRLTRKLGWPGVLAVGMLLSALPASAQLTVFDLEFGFLEQGEPAVLDLVLYNNHPSTLEITQINTLWPFSINPLTSFFGIDIPPRGSVREPVTMDTSTPGTFQRVIWITYRDPDTGATRQVGRWLRGTVLESDVCATDVQAPTVVTATPIDNATVTPDANGRVFLEASATDANEVTLVELLIDGALVATLDTPPFTHQWPSTVGLHAFRARATDECGNTAISAATRFTVSPSGCAADSTKPTVALTLPADGATVTPSATGRVLFRANASDASGIDRVEFWVDGQLVRSDTTSPYAYNWKVTSYGWHTLRARAYDSCGNRRWSTEQTFEVIQN